MSEKPLLLVVACALIDVDGRVLICQRQKGKQLAGLWEFPGGQVEPVDVADLTPGASAALTIQRLIFIDELLGDDPSGPAFAVHCPISLIALSYSGARTAVLGELRRLVHGGRRERLILELIHLPEGLPESRLSEAIAQIRPYARAVVARAPSLATDVSLWARCGARAVVHEAPSGGADFSEKALMAALPGDCR